MLGDRRSLHSSPSGTSVSSSSFMGICNIFLEDRMCNYFLPLGIKDFLAVPLLVFFLVVLFRLPNRLKGLVRPASYFCSSITFERWALGFFLADVRAWAFLK